MVKQSSLATTSEVLAEELKDAEFASVWDRAAFARAVAERMLRYRTDRVLTQTQLARKAGTVQSAIGRLESGDHTPSIATLAQLSQNLGIEFHHRDHSRPRPTPHLTRGSDSNDGKLAGKLQVALSTILRRNELGVIVGASQRRIAWTVCLTGRICRAECGRTGWLRRRPCGLSGRSSNVLI